jgi:hypothetical protein
MKPAVRRLDEAFEIFRALHLCFAEALGRPRSERDDRLDRRLFPLRAGRDVLRDVLRMRPLRSYSLHVTIWRPVPAATGPARPMQRLSRPPNATKPPTMGATAAAVVVCVCSPSAPVPPHPTQMRANEAKTTHLLAIECLPVLDVNVPSTFSERERAARESARQVDTTREPRRSSSHEWVPDRPGTRPALGAAVSKALGSSRARTMLEARAASRFPLASPLPAAPEHRQSPARSRDATPVEGGAFRPTGARPRLLDAGSGGVGGGATRPAATRQARHGGLHCASEQIALEPRKAALAAERLLSEQTEGARPVFTGGIRL